MMSGCQFVYIVSLLSSGIHVKFFGDENEKCFDLSAINLFDSSSSFGVFHLACIIRRIGRLGIVFSNL